MHCPVCHTLMKKYDQEKKSWICQGCGLVHKEWLEKAKKFMETQQFADALEEIKAKYK